MRQTLTAFILAALLWGCKNNTSEFLPVITFGQPEAEWRKNIDRLVKNGTLEKRPCGDTLYAFNWSLEDTTIKVYVALNDGYIRQGPITTYSFDFSTHPACDSGESFTKGQAFKMEGRDQNELCTQQTFWRIKARMDKKYGFADSIGVSGSDTVYYYREKDLDLILEKAIPSPENKGDDKDRYQHTFLYIVAKNHQQMQDSVGLAVEKSKDVGELVQLSFNPPIMTTAIADDGIRYPALKLTLRWAYNKHKYAKKPIEMLKGTLRIQDRFSDDIYTKTELEYRPQALLQPGEFNQAAVGEGWTLILDKREAETTRIYDAVQMNKELSVVYEPTAIYYADRSVVKRQAP